MHLRHLAPLRRPLASLLLAGATLLTGAALTGCGPAAVGTEEAAWPPLTKKWYERALGSYRVGDLEDAQIAVDNARRIPPRRDEIELLAGKIALAQLEYDRALQLLRGLPGPEAAGLRGRALWYSGQIDPAAEELEALLADPSVRDPWAAEVSKLARRGAGRKPFTLSGGLVAAVEMPQVNSTWLVVPVEVNGEEALGVIATAVAETLIDSSGGAGASWVSLRFGGRVEVRDVPALPKDLSGLSRQIGAPIKILLGINLLRHLRPTIDFLGGQFVVRSFEPPPPPAATTLRVAYVRGGGMVLRGAFGTQDAAPMGTFLVDSSLSFPLALGEPGWKKAGVALSSLKQLPGSGGKLKQGVLPLLRLGAFEIPQIPAVLGVPLDAMAEELQLDLDGVVGSGLIAPFRVSLVDQGRTLWLEDLPPEAAEQYRQHLPAPAAPPAASAPAGPAGSALPATSATPAPAPPASTAQPR